MFKNLIIASFLLFLFGCATWNRTFFAKDLSKISLGEDKSSVVNKLGGSYETASSEMKDGHKVEVLVFYEKPFYVGRANSDFWTPYYIYFVDDKLVKYEHGQPRGEQTNNYQALQLYQAAGQMAKDNQEQQYRQELIKQQQIYNTYPGLNPAFKQNHSSTTCRMVGSSMYCDSY